MVTDSYALNTGKNRKETVGNNINKNVHHGINEFIPEIDHDNTEVIHDTMRTTFSPRQYYHVQVIHGNSDDKNGIIWNINDVINDDNRHTYSVEITRYALRNTSNERNLHNSTGNKTVNKINNNAWKLLRVTPCRRTN